MADVLGVIATMVYVLGTIAVVLFGLLRVFGLGHWRAQH
jgi:hypothetical protein